MRVDVLLERESKNKLNADITKKNLRHISKVVERNKSLRLVGQCGNFVEPDLVTSEKTNEEVYRYRVKMRILKKGSSSPENAAKHLEYAKRLLRERAERFGWNCLEASAPNASVNGDSLKFPQNLPRPDFLVGPLSNQSLAEICQGIYDREEHVRIIHDGVMDFFDTLAKHKENDRVDVSRPHVLLKGPPAGAKTTLFERLKAWYEKDSPVERVTFVDATTASKAGLENWLLEKAESGTLTEIIVLEEIEKQSMDNLLTLVSLMGSGYIAKLNARVGYRKEIAQSLVWATCNQEELIRNFRNGVLWSRFSNKLHCTRPSRDRLHQILMDKIKQRHGNPRWADAAIRFAFESVKVELGKPMDDPRDVISLLAGRDRLLNGSYQKDRLEILRAEIAEKGGKEHVSI